METQTLLSSCFFMLLLFCWLLNFWEKLRCWGYHFLQDFTEMQAQFVRRKQQKFHSNSVWIFGYMKILQMLELNPLCILCVLMWGAWDPSFSVDLCCITSPLKLFFWIAYLSGAFLASERETEVISTALSLYTS